MLFTHGRCVDGLAAAAVARRAWDARWFGLQHDELAPHLEMLADLLAAGTTEAGVAAAGAGTAGAQAAGAGTARPCLLVADLGPQAADVPRIARALERLEGRCPVAWLDHHEPQWPQDVEETLSPHVAYLAVDRTRLQSGASLTLGLALAVARGEQPQLGLPAPRHGMADARFVHHVDRVRARDTWSEPGDETGTRLMLVARRLRDEDFVRLFAAGCFRALRVLSDEDYRRHGARVEEAQTRVAKPAPDVGLLLGPGPLSDTAAALWRSDPEARVLLHVRPGGGLGVRSREDAPVAARVAGRFGGGGHAHAAGGRLVEGRLRTWWLGRRGPRHRRVRHAVAAAREALGHEGAAEARPPRPWRSGPRRTSRTGPRTKAAQTGRRRT